MDLKIKELVRTRRKTLALQIKSDGSLVVRAPLGISQQYIEKIIHKKRNWIRRKKQEVGQRSSSKQKKKFVEGEEFLYLGNYYKLCISAAGSAGLCFDNEFLLPQGLLDKAKEVFIKWYKDRAKEIIKERHKCVFIHSKGEVSFHEDATLTLHYHDLTEITELKGQGTFPGRYTGKVKLIKNKQDIENLQGGEVLVLRMTTTDLITPNLQKAGAIITDEGGITCHAAILSREFKIPCVIGTQVATKILKDHDIVELDAEKGTITVDNKHAKEFS